MSDRVIALETILDLDRLTDMSQERPVLIYKHSTACPICARTYRLYHDLAESDTSNPAPFFAELFVIENREVSDDIETRFSVRHQTPQLLLLKAGEAVWDSSHFDITEDAIAIALDATSTD